MSLPNVPGLPSWNEGASDRLSEHGSLLRRELGAMRHALDAAEAVALESWSGVTKDAFVQRLDEIRNGLVRLEADLIAIPLRLRHAGDEADTIKRRGIAKALGPGAEVLNEIALATGH